MSRWEQQPLPLEDAVFVYAIAETSGPHVKIGHALDLNNRLKALQNGNPHRLFVAYCVSLPSRAVAFRIEKTAHDLLRKNRRSGEWFACSLGDATQAINRASKKHGVHPLFSKRLGEGPRAVRRVELNQ